MPTHSIFDRQWWAVALRSTHSAVPQQRVERLALQIARAIGGSFPATLKPASAGVSIVPNAEMRKLTDNADGSKGNTKDSPAVSVIPKGTVASIMMLQSETAYFPLAEESLEGGVIPFSKREDCDRDFPRRLKGGGKSYIYQYPLIVAAAPLAANDQVTVVSSPYFKLLKDLLANFRPGELFTMCVGIDVEKAFNELKKPTLVNGNLTVRSGRMVIRGIDNLRAAVFTGTNVIDSSLYLQLTNTEGVVVHPKDCRLQRAYKDPVGGNRRPFVTWFDANGNFRFTPGCDPTSTVIKFVELLTVLRSMQLVRNAETYNPLNRVGARAGAEGS